MAKAKATKGIDTRTLVAAIGAAYDDEVAARRARISALRDWSKETAGLKALTDDQAQKVRDDLRAAYEAKGLKEKSALVMALQDVRFLKAYNSDAKFRTVADTLDSVTAAFVPPKRDPNKPDLLRDMVKAIRKAKLDNRTIALQFITQHPERAIVLIESHLKELSKVGAQLQEVSRRSEPAPAPQVRRVRRGNGATQVQVTA